jgi:2-oxoisovalerate dehydrogenase E1 component alpha subunit
VQEWTELDYPILRYRRLLEDRGWWDSEQDKEWISSVKKQVMETFARAEKVKKLPVEELFVDVYDELPKSLQVKKHRKI